MPLRRETGSCFCGSIAAEVDGEPFWVCYDHDDDCRRALGSPLMIWIGYEPESFRFVRGMPKSFSKTRGVTRTFCGNCGTSISYADDGLQDELYLSIGFMDNADRFAPQAHAYWRSKLPWLEMPDGLPRIDTYSRQRGEEFGNPADR